MFGTSNAAFRHEDGDLDRSEVALVIEGIANDIKWGSDYGSVIDANGNKVGSWKLED